MRSIRESGWRHRHRSRWESLRNDLDFKIRSDQDISACTFARRVMLRSAQRLTHSFVDIKLTQHFERKRNVKGPFGVSCGIHACRVEGACQSRWLQQASSPQQVTQDRRGAWTEHTKQSRADSHSHPFMDNDKERKMKLTHKFEEGFLQKMPWEHVSELIFERNVDAPVLQIWRTSWRSL